MTATVLDGAAIAQTVFAGLSQRLRALEVRNVRPGLAAVHVGDDPASAIYVRHKVRACDELGIHSEVHRFEAGCSEREVLERVGRLNHDARIHGVLVQLPLPAKLDADRIQQAVVPEKDVDGFTWRNLGALVAGHPVLAPCTPLGVMAMLDHARVTLAGRNAVVVGRSLIVGKPLALMLIARGATVTVCNSKTQDLQRHTSSADILAVAVGRPGLIDGQMVKPGAVVVDIGINRLPDGKLAGDVDFASVSRVASLVTPVPGGVGRMTVAMLMANTVTAAERQAGSALQGVEKGAMPL